MALLFDQNQGSFQDTGSQRSPMKKNTGLMRKEMNKLDEVAPRGHTLAYITPEEAQILNRGGGGVDQEGNQMMGPYGVPMYPGYGSRGYQGAGKASGGDQGGSISRNTSSSNDRPTGNNQQKQKQERPKNMPAMLSYEPPKKNFNTDNFMEAVGNSIGGNKETINQGLLIDPGLQAALDKKEKGDGILERKGEVSNKIIEHLKTNVPQTEKEQIELLYVVDRFPNSIKNKIKKAVDDGEISLMVDATKLPNAQKLLRGDIVLPNTAPPSIIARENTKKNLVHAPSKLLDRPLGMPVHLTYSTSVGDTKLSNVYAKIYNNEKENLITDYSSLFKKENVDSLFSQIPTQAKIGKELGVSLIDQALVKLRISTTKPIYDAMAKKFKSDFSPDIHKELSKKAYSAYKNIKPWIEMQFNEDREVAYYDIQQKDETFKYVKKDEKIVPLIQSFKNEKMAMYIDDSGRFIEYPAPKELNIPREGWDVWTGKKLGFDNYEEEQFSSRYNAALNVLTDGTTRPYYAAQPIIKEIMENNPTKYGDINEAWSSKGGHADAAKNFIGGFEYGYYASEYKNEYKNMGMLYQANQFKDDAKSNNIAGMNDALPDVLDNIAGINLGAEYAEKGLALPSIEELAQLGLEYADVVKRPLLTNDSLMNP